MITDFIYTIIMVNQILENSTVAIFIYIEFQRTTILSVKLTFDNVIYFLANKLRSKYKCRGTEREFVTMTVKLNTKE